MRRMRIPTLALAAALAWTWGPVHAAEPSEEDTAVIESLQSQGVDLTQPRLVEFLFSFQSVRPARQVGKTLAAEGFQNSIDPGGGGKDVLLLARKHVVLTPADITALRARFEALAKSAGGQYEGWGLP